jgi:hypothetical protein
MIKTFFIIFLFISLVANAAFWDSKITVVCQMDKETQTIFYYEFKDGQILETQIFPKRFTNTGKDELMSLSKLEDCVINNSKNWKCGGSATTTREGMYSTEEHSVLEGRYRFFPGGYLNKQKGKDTYCNKRIQSN